MIINGGGAGGTGSDECTARLSDVPAGLKAVTADSNDEAGVGTMTMTGNAQAAHVLAGETFYTNNCKTKLTGAMTVGSILSFSAQAYSGRQILLKWQNPYAATGRPFSGVHVWYSTGGYPGVGGGTWLYSGYGGNSTSGGWCQAVATLPNLNTTYYFTACSYATCSAGDLWGTTFNAAAATGADLWLTFTASQNYTVPMGYTQADVFAVGGGGSGGNEYAAASGGGGGYTLTERNRPVIGGNTYSVIVGAGGAGKEYDEYRGQNGNNGGASYINGISTISANGGGGGGESIGAARSKAISNGGSGGGDGGFSMNGAEIAKYGGGNGGSDGSRGALCFPTQTYVGCQGQGTTTRAWGSPSGTLYAGGGGGAAGSTTYAVPIGYGGAGGGGNGSGSPRYNTTHSTGGGVNTGGGAGGEGCQGVGGAGGSGIVLLHLY